MLRQVSSLVGGVAKPVGRIFSAFAALQEFVIDLETDERSALTVFAYSNHYVHSPDSTLPETLHGSSDRLVLDKIRLPMTPDQLRIAEWLAQEVPTLPPAFIQVVQLMAGSDFPGRCNQVCHACRDICTVIQQHHRVEKTVKAGTTKLLNELDALWLQ